MSPKQKIAAILSLIPIVTGCAHVEMVREQNPRAVLESVCGIGRQVKRASGNVWLKASSKEASGQFPAQVVVTAENGNQLDRSQPSDLRIEAHNLLGATVALITARGNAYKVEVPGHPEKTQKGSGSWGGIPLEWATDLFLGKVPCPSPSDVELSWSAEGKLVVQTAPSLGSESQKFVFGLKTVDRTAWPQDLHWERTGFAPLAVDFKFSNPEDQTLSPLRWEAKSSLGEIKVRWKDREYE